MTQHPDVPHPPSRATRQATEGMDVTGPRLEALRLVDAQRVQYDVDSGVFVLDGQLVTGSTRRTYGDLRRRQLIQEAHGTGRVPVRLTPPGMIVVDDYRDRPAET